MADGQIFRYDMLSYSLSRAYPATEGAHLSPGARHMLRASKASYLRNRETIAWITMAAAIPITALTTMLAAKS